MDNTSLNTAAAFLELVYLFALPAVMLYILRRKQNGKIFPAVCGFIGYMFISFIRAFFWMLVPAGALSNALLSGITEECGKFFIMKYLINSYDTPEDSVSYGIGHGGSELILANAAIMINNILTGEAVPSGIFEIVGAANAMVSHIALTMLVYISVHYRESRKFLFYAVLIHIADDFIKAILIKNLDSVPCFILFVIVPYIFTAGTVILAHKYIKDTA